MKGRQMTEFEIYEAFMSTLEMSVLASMNFVAIVFAYLVAAYVAGQSLSRNVAIGLSIIFTVFLVPPFMGTLSNLRRAFDAGAYLTSHFPDSWAAQGSVLSFEVYVVLFGVPMIAGWLGSLYYMHRYVRGSAQADQ
jgi:hypothetical protein